MNIIEREIEKRQILLADIADKETTVAQLLEQLDSLKTELAKYDVEVLKSEITELNECLDVINNALNAEDTVDSEEVATEDTTIVDEAIETNVEVNYAQN